MQGVIVKWFEWLCDGVESCRKVVGLMVGFAM